MGRRFVHVFLLCGYIVFVLYSCLSLSRLERVKSLIGPAARPRLPISAPTPKRLPKRSRNQKSRAIFPAFQVQITMSSFTCFCQVSNIKMHFVLCFKAILPLLTPFNTPAAARS